MNKPLNILIIEDSEDDARILVRELRRGGYEVTYEQAYRPEHVKSALTEKTWDVIFCDYSMPQFTGIDALNIFRQAGLDTPFIFVSGTIGEDVAVNAMKAGAHDYVMKTNLKRLVPAVERELKDAEVRRERKRVENALRESELRFRHLLRSSPAVIYSLKISGDSYVPTWVSDNIEEIMGFSAEETLKPTWFHENLHRDNRQEILRSRELLLKNGRVLWEYRIRKRDGTYHWIQDHQLLLRDETGTPVEVVGAWADISSRKETELVLESQKAYFHLLFENAPVGIVMLDSDQIIQNVNKAFTEIFQYSFEETKGRNIDEILTPDSLKEEARELSQKAKEGHIFHRSTVRKARDESLIDVDVIAYPIVIRGQHVGVYALYIDMREQKKLERQFLRAQRMESVGTLAGGIAHDLNNVLSPILMGVAMLKRVVTDEKGRRMLETLESCAARGAALVKQVLTFVRGTEGERTEIQPGYLVIEIEKMARETFPKSIQIHTKVPGNLWLVAGNATQMHQVLMNLCVNARDAMPNGGKISMTAENVILDEQYAKMNIEAKPGPYVMIRVSDSGSGMPPGILAKIFEPFFTTKETGKGTGLGLATVAGIVKSHGGFVNVYSEIGKGSVFRVHFPALGTTETKKAAEKEAVLPSGNGETILIADDEASVREITKETLRMVGYKVLEAGDGAEAVALYAARSKEVSVVITDMVMPFMDGPATIRALAKINPDVKIVAASGLSDPQILDEPARSVVKAVLQKPYTAETLLTTLRNVLQGDGGNSP